ncbi:MAG: hypothetical protein PWQ41_1510 [Bacillota bacterium]|jgi:hypothetical protein|nr:hypothetical protein [Bacillota bacterium]MDK2925736.1 hypothetical protein [Bacillota bacterium]
MAPYQFDETCTLDERLLALREDLIGELVAINQYQRHAMETRDRNLAEVFCHAMNDEKEHVAMLMHAIMMLDPVQHRRMMEMMGQMPGLPPMPPGGPGMPPHGYNVPQDKK